MGWGRPHEEDGERLLGGGWTVCVQDSCPKCFFLARTLDSSELRGGHGSSGSQRELPACVWWTSVAMTDNKLQHHQPAHAYALQHRQVNTRLTFDLTEANARA